MKQYESQEGANMKPCCPFCNPDEILSPIEWVAAGAVMVFEPLNPVTPGHLLVVPLEHVEHAASDPALTGNVMQAAADVASLYDSSNIITSIGPQATQTVRHLHVHVVPRSEGDGLPLPWTGQEA